MTSAQAADEFRNSLLEATFANALHTPFYRDHLADYISETVDLSTWQDLPFVSKTEIKAAGKNAQHTNDLICNEIFTGGTTGDPLTTLKGDREQHYIGKFYNFIFEERNKQNLIRALQINNPYHGHLVPVPVPMHSHKIGIYDAGSFSYGRKILASEHQDRGVDSKCTILIGLERCLRAFTHEARLACPDGLDSNLQVIISYSQYLTQRWRNIHAETWNCTVIDRFGLSEIFGGATQDPDCGWWFFDPVCLPEVVGARSRTIIKEGIGELVLTALFPFQEAQPMIRYLTGDLVKVTHSCPSRPGVLAIKPLGRIRYGVQQKEGDDFLIIPASVAEMVDSFPEIKRMPRFQDSPQVTCPVEIGHPYYSIKYKTENGKTRITLYLVAKDQIKSHIVDNIYNNLLESSPALHAAIIQKEAEFNIQFVDKLSPDLISHAE